MENTFTYTFTSSAIGQTRIGNQDEPLTFRVSEPELMMDESCTYDDCLKRAYLGRRVLLKHEGTEYYTEYIEASFECKLAPVQDSDDDGEIRSRLGELRIPRDLVHSLSNLLPSESNVVDVSRHPESTVAFLMSLPRNLTAGIGDMRTSVNANFHSANVWVPMTLTGYFKLRFESAEMMSGEPVMPTVSSLTNDWILTAEMTHGTATIGY